MGDRPHIARDYLAEDIVNFGIERADVRDELYLQILKVNRFVNELAMNNFLVLLFLLHVDSFYWSAT